MPIYAYKCAACGFEKDLIQKFSDAPLTQCPACGAEAFSKQLTAPAFQLKGSGWYVTDFRDGGQKKAADKPFEGKEGAASEAGDASGKNDAGESKGTSESAAAAEKSAPASSSDNSPASSGASKASSASSSNSASTSTAATT
jgi:putative FmdB family regulatory protein